MEEIAAFIKWTITYYKEKEWKDYDLWEGFFDDYCSFTLETFRNCDINTIKDIREHLRQNGVYVRKSRSIEVVKILFELLQENEPAKQPANDLPTATAIKISATQPTGTSAIQLTRTSTIQPTGTSAIQPTGTSAIQPTEQTTQLDFQPQPTATEDYSRQIATLLKLYTDKMKYNGQKDNFDFKFKVFQTYYVQASVPQAAYTIAINIMLKDQALKYYFTHLKNEPLESICIRLKGNFKGDEYKQDILDE